MDTTGNITRHAITEVKTRGGMGRRFTVYGSQFTVGGAAGGDGIKNQGGGMELGTRMRTVFEGGERFF
jgi:hypothetical protein